MTQIGDLLKNACDEDRPTRITCSGRSFRAALSYRLCGTVTVVVPVDVLFAASLAVMVIV